MITNSISTLRTLSSASNSEAYVASYYGDGLGGGGLYRLDQSDTTSIDNCGTIIVAADLGRWKYIGEKSLINVDNFGAKGDGVTDDKPAFYAMANAMNGNIKLADKRYNINGMILSKDYISIIGSKKPIINASFTKIENGPVLVGSINIRAYQVSINNFGVDSGICSSLGSGTEGIAIAAPDSSIGKQCEVANIAVLGSVMTSPTHSILVEGFDENRIENIDCALRAYGVVLKGRKGFVNNIRAYKCNDASVFVKSDVPPYANFGSDVRSVEVSNVYGETDPSNTSCSHLYIHASTSALYYVNASNIRGKYGYAAVRVAGGSGPVIASSVNISQVTATQTNTGVELFGTNYDVQVCNLHAEEPASGKAFRTSGASYNWKFQNITLVITDPSITGILAAELNGTGIWDNFSVRNSYNQMQIPFLPANIICGKKRGDVSIIGEGMLSPGSGSNTGSGVPAVKCDILPGNEISLSGVITTAVATGTNLVNIQAGSSGNKKFIVQGTNTSGAPIPVYLSVSGNTLYLLSPVLSGLASIDLSGITYKY